MRIVFIVPQLADGGAEREAAAFADELAKIGEEVHIICFHDIKDDFDVDERIHRHLFHGTRVRMPKLKGMCNQILMTKLLRKIRGDVALPFYVPFQLAVLLSGTKLIYAVRGNLEKELESPYAKISNKMMCHFADGIWIQTQDQRCFFSENLQHKLFEVHNILELRFRQIYRNPLKKVTRFINVGRLHPQKNQTLLIKAFERMIRRDGNDSATLTIYGRSRKHYRQTEEELNTLINRLQLQDRVFLAGWVDNIEEKYEEADAFVLSSDYEGCPNALMEAMAAGLPCISTDCPTGPSMLIESGENGLLVPVGNEEAMSRAMQCLIEHPQKANRLGNAARQRMREWGTAREHAEQLRENLRRICLE